MNNGFLNIIDIAMLRAITGGPLKREEIDKLKIDITKGEPFAILDSLGSKVRESSVVADVPYEEVAESKDPFVIRGKAINSFINSFRSYMDTLGLKYTKPIDVPYKEVND